MRYEALTVASLLEILKMTYKQISSFEADFDSRLPKYLQIALHQVVLVV